MANLATMNSMKVITVWLLMRIMSIKCLSEQQNSESVMTPKVSDRRLSYHPDNGFNCKAKWQQTKCPFYGTSPWTSAYKGSVNKMNITINIEKYCSNTKRSSMD